MKRSMIQYEIESFVGSAVIYLNISSEELRKLSLLGFKLYPRRIKVGVYTEIASEARCTPSQSSFWSQFVFFCLQKQPFSLLKNRLKFLTEVYWPYISTVQTLILPTMICSPFSNTFANEYCQYYNRTK